MRGWWLVLALVACHPAATETHVAPLATTTGQAPRATTAQPTRAKRVITDTQVEILDGIRFLSGSAALDPSSTPILDAVASTLTGNPSIKLVAVHAYGADTLAQFQGRVGAERAQAIIEQLVARGVKRSRLVAQGEATPPPGGALGPSFEILARDP